MAAARAIGDVRHVGAVGRDGAWAINRLRGYGVGTRHVAVLDAPTGHAAIVIDDRAEILIILHPGTNRLIP